MSEVYKDFPEQWLLMDVLSYDDEGRPLSFKLLFWSKLKDELHEFIMENETEDKKYLLLYADPEKPCEL